MNWPVSLNRFSDGDAHHYVEDNTPITDGDTYYHIETNDKGGKQSYLGMRFDLIDPKAIKRLAETLHHGFVKYGRDNWRLIETESHLNHALVHIFEFLDGNNGEDHLAHAFCRVMMAMVIDRDGVASPESA